MKIRKFNESVNIDNEEIKLMFPDYLHSNSIEIEDKYLIDNKVIDKTPYIKDPSKVQHCKVVTISVGEGDGIKLSDGKCMTDFEMLEDIIAELKRFYLFHNEDINFFINTDYMGIQIKFVIKGEYLELKDSKADLVTKHLNALKDAIKGKKSSLNPGYRIKVSNNWLEMGGRDAGSIRSTLYRVINGQYNREHIYYTQSSLIKKLVDWYEKVVEDDLGVSVGGGDNQLVVKMKLN
jgi:hypothetical protein